MNAGDRKQLVTQLFMLTKTAQIHQAGNRAFQQPFDQFSTFLSRMLAEEAPLTLEAIEMALYLNEVKIRSDIATFGIFRHYDQAFAERDVGGFRITKLPTPEELMLLLRILASGKEASTKGADAINAAFVGRGFDSIEFLPRSAKRTVARSDLTEAAGSKKRALKNYVKAIDVIRNVTTGKSGQYSVEARKAKRLVYDLVDICLEEGFSFIGLAAIKNYDEYTFNHSVNVCVISIGFGKNLGLSKRQLGELGLAGLYHDYGKMLIPLDILNKPGKFNPDEWEIMKTHPLMSIKKLLSMKGGFQPGDIKKMVAAFEHHRNYDCTGYPQTGVVKQLNFYSRVVAIADAYDAMTTNRVYQRGMLPTVALKILTESAGTKFDPLLVKAFVNTVGIYPVGSVVRLTDGSLGVVTAVSKLPDKIALPEVRLATDPGGRRIEGEVRVDLAAEGAALSIDTVVHAEDYGINVAQLLFGEAVK